MARFAPQHLEEHHERWDARLLLLGRVLSVAVGVFVLLRLPMHLLGPDDWSPFVAWLSHHSAYWVTFAELTVGQRVLAVALDVVAGAAFVASGSRELPLRVGVLGWGGAWVVWLVLGAWILGSFGL